MHSFDLPIILLGEFFWRIFGIVMTFENRFRLLKNYGEMTRLRKAC